MECDDAAETLNNHIRRLNSAYMDVVSQSLEPKRGSSLQVYNQQVERAAAELSDTIEPLRQAAKYEAENIGHHVSQLSTYFEPLVQGTIGAASNMTSSKQQELLLNQAKSVTESALQLIYAAKDCGGNTKAVNLHPEVDECAASTRDALQELVTSLETISTQSGIVSGVVDNLNRAMTRLSDHRASLILPDAGNYVDYQTCMVECAKDIAKIAGEMVICFNFELISSNFRLVLQSTKAAIEPQRLAPLSADLQHKYTQLANDSVGAAATSTNGEVAMKLKEIVHDLGVSCVDLVRVGGECQIRRDEMSLKNIGHCSRAVAEKVITIEF